MALTCSECGRESDAATNGWRAYHALEQFNDDETVMTFCPECSEREFGPRTSQVRELEDPTDESL